MGGTCGMPPANRLRIVATSNPGIREVASAAAAPATALALHVEQGEVVGIHFRNQERHVLGHPERGGVAHHQDTCRSEGGFDIACHGRVER